VTSRYFGLTKNKPKILDTYWNYN